MFPWFWLWAPQWHLPFSGDVAQRIAPQTDWFFGAIAPEAGVASVEQKAFAVASYGRQLGLLTELLLELAERTPPQSDEAREALARLQAIRARIEAIKRDDADATAARLVDEAERLRRRDPQAFARVAAQLAAAA